MILQCFQEEGTEVDREIVRAYYANQYIGVNYNELISSAAPSRVKDTIGCVQTENSPTTTKELSDVGRPELPFLFPIHQEENPLIQMLCERCLKSETQV